MGTSNDFNDNELIFSFSVSTSVANEKFVNEEFATELKSKGGSSSKGVCLVVEFSLKECCIGMSMVSVLINAGSYEIELDGIISDVIEVE